MMKELHLSIVSPEKSVFDGEVKIVTLPGTVGSFSILPGHAPIVSSLKAGTLGYTTMDGEEHTLDMCLVRKTRWIIYSRKTQRHGEH